MTTQVLELDDLARTRDAHVAALNANDADGWVACFAPDAVQMPPNEPANVGTASIHAWSAGMLPPSTPNSPSTSTRPKSGVGRDLAVPRRPG